MRVSYRFEDNIARLGTSAPPSSDSGSYRADQVGFEIVWSGDVWRGTTESESEDGN